jgi:hypothetical protein
MRNRFMQNYFFQIPVCYKKSVTTYFLDAIGWKWKDGEILWIKKYLWYSLAGIFLWSVLRYTAKNGGLAERVRKEDQPELGLGQMHL